MEESVKQSASALRVPPAEPPPRARVSAATARVEDEPYKGPGRVITSLGYNVVDWHIAWIPMALVSVGLGVFMPKQVMEARESMQTFVKQAKQDDGIFRKAGTWLADRAVHSGDWVTRNFPFSEWIHENIGKERWQPFSFVAGITTVIGAITSGISGIWRGVSNADAGREQFTRAQREIRDLRAENKALRGKNAELAVSSPPVQKDEEAAAAQGPEIPRAQVRAEEAQLHERAMPVSGVALNAL